jgi:ribosomal protein L22
MAEENKTESKETKQPEKKVEEKKVEEKTEKKTEVKIAKKKDVVVNGRSLGISTKYSMAICNMIRRRTIDEALKMLEEALEFKRVIKMNDREVPHKKGKGVMAGRNPQKAIAEFIRMVKQLKANATAQEVEYESMVISCKANLASRPYRRRGHRFKRTHVSLKLEEKKTKGAKKKSRK